MATPYPVINGVYHSFAQVELTINGTTFGGFSSINYTDTLEHGEVYGNAPEKLGNTLGQLKCEGNCEIYLPHFLDFITSVGSGWMAINYPVLVQYAATGLPIAEDQLVGVRFKSSGINAQKGPDAIVRKLDFTYFKPVNNGIVPILGIP